MCYPVKSLFIVLFYRSIKYKSDPLGVEKSPTEDGCFVISDWGEQERVHLLRTLPVTTETPSKVPTRQPRSRMAPCLMKMPSNIKHTAGDSCYVYWPARLNAKSTSHTSPHSSACEATARACPAEEHISTFAPSLPFRNHVKHVAFGKYFLSYDSLLWPGSHYLYHTEPEITKASKTHVHLLIHLLLLDLMSKYKLCNDSYPYK